MDATPPPALKINRLLPYWAVFQADVAQTFHSWLYRVWVLLSVGAAAGYLTYRYGAAQLAGMTQPAPETVGDLLHWVVFGSTTLIIVLTAGAICAERGTMADSVLSRGISRHQYFLGKWHARLALVLTTFLLKGALALVAAYFLLHNSDHLSPAGCGIALLTVAALLACIITCGVSVSALSSNTVVSIAVAWTVLYGLGFGLSLLPGHVPSPARALHNLPGILKGHFDGLILGRLIAGSAAASVVMAAAGMVCFSRRDV